jgi:hypothetical protein
MSTLSLSEAIEGALRNGHSGRAYLVGDENMTFQSFFAAFSHAVGNFEPIPILEQEHALGGSYAGAGAELFYEPDADENASLGYRRRDVLRAIAEVVAQYRFAH